MDASPASQMGFWRSVFSESDGTGSWSRIAGCFSLAAVLAWATRVVLFTHAIPDLTNPALFISAPYGFNLAHRVATAAVTKAPVQDQAQVPQPPQ